MPAVEAPFELDQPVPPGMGAGDADGHLGRLAAVGHEAHVLGGGHHVPDQLRPLHRQLRLPSGMQPPLRLARQGLDDHRVCVAEQHRAVPEPVVEVVVAVHVALAGPAILGDERREWRQLAGHVGVPARRQRLLPFEERARPRVARQVLVLDGLQVHPGFRHL